MLNVGTGHTSSTSRWDFACVITYMSVGISLKSCQWCRLSVVVCIPYCHLCGVSKKPYFLFVPTTLVFQYYSSLFLRGSSGDTRTGSHSGDLQTRCRGRCSATIVRCSRGDAKILRWVVMVCLYRGRHVIPAVDPFGEHPQSFWVLQDFRENTHGSSSCHSGVLSCVRN